MTFLQVFAVILLVTTTTHATCPALTAVVGFDAAQFEGIWYEYKRTTSAAQLLDKCVVNIFTQDGNGGFDMEYTRVGIISRENATTDIKLTAVDGADPGTFKLTFTDGYFSDRLSRNFLVLFTDYNNWAVTYSCDNYFFGSIDRFRIITRVRGYLRQRSLNRVVEQLEGAGLDSSRLYDSLNTDCEADFF